MKTKDRNIVELIWNRYEIDISEDNILQKYRLDPAQEISREELIRLLDEQKGKWENAANSPREKTSAAAKEKLRSEPKYREILLDDQLRGELFRYYQKAGEGSEVTAAREFFALVKQTKPHISKEDVNFYFSFFAVENKSRKSVRSMLEKEFKVRFSKGGDKGDTSEVETPDKKNGRTGKSASPSSVVCNNFSRETLLAIRKCENALSKAAKSREVTNVYPQLKEETSVYDFLCGDLPSGKKPAMEDFSQIIRRGKDTAGKFHSAKLDITHDFQDVLNFFNGLDDLLSAQDVKDNFTEFLILLKYPALSSYMYEFEEVKPTTLQEFYTSAVDKQYRFGSFNLFVLDYFMPMYSHFGIPERPLRKTFQQAQGSAGREEARRKALNAVEKLREALHLPKGVQLKYMLPYWPIYLFYLIFELFKGIVTYLKQIVTVAGVLASVAMAVYLVVDAITSNTLNQWLVPVTTGMGFLTAVDFIACLVDWIMVPVLIIGIPAALTFLLRRYAASLYKAIDWIGYERTFQRILTKCRDNAERRRKEKAVSNRKKS